MLFNIFFTIHLVYFFLKNWNYNFVGTKFILPPPGYAVLPLNFTTQNSEGELLMLLVM